jgi:MFS transporter, DHA1 family, multidrug resistance protein
LRCACCGRNADRLLSDLSRQVYFSLDEWSAARALDILGSVGTQHSGMGFRQFVTLIASLMALNALAIDSMLPALPQMGAALNIPTDNERQWIITAYMLGLGLAQLIYGTLADRFGRKRILLGGVAAYALFSITAMFAQSLESMIIARALQGAGAAAPQVLAVSIVRDCYSGPKMARVMSLTFIVFLAAPVIAPAMGQVILLVAEWQWIFGVLAAFSGVLFVWASLRLPETLRAENRRSIALGRILQAFRVVFSTRVSIGYMLAMAFVFGGLIGFINSVQQVFADVFQAPDIFPAIFAMIAIFIAMASFLNAKIVERVGVRVVSHRALVGYLAFASVHFIVALSGHETIASFTLLQAGMLFCFGLVVSNFGAIAMEPLGHVAGTASSVQGFITIAGGALIGFTIGQQFDGTVIPLTLGFVGSGFIALTIVLITERGRLFQNREPELLARPS